MLARFKNFINRHCAQGKPCNIKQDARKFVLAWVPCDDPPAGSICIRTDNACLQRMINPLSDADKKNPDKQQEGVYVCNALNVENQSNNSATCPQNYEYVIPITYLKPGEQFIHFAEIPYRFIRIHRFSLFGLKIAEFKIIGLYHVSTKNLHAGEQVISNHHKGI
jgi:hypothetical protein